MSDTKNSEPSFGGYSFSELVEVAKSTPDKLEKIRTELVEDAISSAPIEYRKRLEGLQSDSMKRLERVKNPLSRAELMSQMMLDSVDDLRTVLETGKDPRKQTEPAKVLPLTKK